DGGGGIRNVRGGEPPPLFGNDDGGMGRTDSGRRLGPLAATGPRRLRGDAYEPGRAVRTRRRHRLEPALCGHKVAPRRTSHLSLPKAPLLANDPPGPRSRTARPALPSGVRRGR